MHGSGEVQRQGRLGDGKVGVGLEGGGGGGGEGLEGVPQGQEGLLVPAQVLGKVAGGV